MYRLIVPSVLIAFLAAPAVAADLVIEQPVIYSDTAVSDWSGFYAGVHVGYGWSDIQIEADEEEYWRTEGWLLGAQAGANWQHGSFVLGLEGDIAWSGVEGPEDQEGTIDEESVARYDWLTTIRGRAGFDLGGVMPYLTAGLAAASITYSDSGIEQFSGTETGYVLGAGVEAMLDDNWSVKGEYLYANFGANAYDDVDEDADDVVLHTVRLGLNYSF